MNAKLNCAGDVNQDRLSYKFKPFTPKEIEQYLSLYIYQGINRSPQLMMKIKSQSMEPVQINDLIAAKLGNNFVYRHCQFRIYFVYQHSYKPIPATTTHPN